MWYDLWYVLLCMTMIWLLMHDLTLLWYFSFSDYLSDLPLNWGLASSDLSIDCRCSRESKQLRKLSRWTFTLERSSTAVPVMLGIFDKLSFCRNVWLIYRWWYWGNCSKFMGDEEDWNNKIQRCLLYQSLLFEIKEEHLREKLKL